MLHARRRVGGRVSRAAKHEKDIVIIILFKFGPGTIRVGSVWCQS